MENKPKFNSKDFNFQTQDYSLEEKRELISDLRKIVRTFENSLEPKHILFIGNTGFTRSAAAENLFQNSDDYEARSAGLFPIHSDKKINTEKIRFAGKIIVMNEKQEKQKTQLLELFPEAEKKEILTLEIEDKYTRYDDELIEVLKKKLAEKGIDI